mgnify:CR=1 FL=1
MEVINEKDWTATMSRFQVVILASLRSKQLLRGAHPRVLENPLKRRTTSIALEELKRGRITFRGASFALPQSRNSGPNLTVGLLEHGAELKLLGAN